MSVESSAKYITETYRLFETKMSWEEATTFAADILEKRSDARHPSMAKIIQSLREGILPREEYMWALPKATQMDIISALRNLPKNDLIRYTNDTLHAYRPTNRMGPNRHSAPIQPRARGLNRRRY